MKAKNSVIITVILVILVGAAAFFGGMRYQKSQTRSQFASQFGGASGGRFGNRQFGQRNGANGGAVVGQILSTDANSMTVKLQNGSSKIVLLSNSTSINKQATGSVSDLKTGDRVAVFGTANSDGSVTAQSVQLNPTFGPGMRSGAQVTPTLTK